MSFSTFRMEVPSVISSRAKEFLNKNCSHFMLSEKFISEHPLLLDRLKIDPVFMPIITGDCLEAILNFDVYSDDVFICALPKSGSSWMSTIVWLLTHNLDYKTIETTNRYSLMGNFDAIEIAIDAKKRAKELLTIDESKPTSDQPISPAAALLMAWNEIFNCLESPRIMKTHHPSHLLPKKIWSKGARAIYVVRNIKDMAVSLYYFLRNFFHVDSTMDDVVNSIANDMSVYSPLPDHVYTSISVLNT